MRFSSPPTLHCPSPRDTHGQSRLGPYPCPPGSPAGPSLGAPLQAEKGDKAWRSYQPPLAPRGGPGGHATAGLCCKCIAVQPVTAPGGSGYLISLSGYRTETQSGRVTPHRLLGAMGGPELCRQENQACDSVAM